VKNNYSALKYTKQKPPDKTDGCQTKENE